MKDTRSTESEMPTLVMRLDVSLGLELNENAPESVREYAGCPLRKVAPSDSRVIFYDWSFDATNHPVAFEVHLEPDDGVFNGTPSIRSLDYITFNPFPVIWLTESRTGTPAGLEAWGRLEFFRDDSGKLIIAVETEDALTRQQLQEMLNSHRLGLKR